MKVEEFFYRIERLESIANTNEQEQNLQELDHPEVIKPLLK